MIVRSSSVPCYKQLAEIIRDNIRSGVYREGSQIPGEMELAEQYDLNRHTVSKAMKELVGEGLLYRTQGKGTFVSLSKLPYEMTRASYFSRSIRSANREPRAKLLDAHSTRCDKLLADEMELTAGDPVTVLKILRFIGDIPAQITTTHLSKNRFPDITTYLNGSFSLYDVLFEHYGVSPVRERVTVECGMPEQRDLEVMQMPNQIPLLLVKSIAREPGGPVVELSRHRGRADIYRLVFDFGDSTDADPI